MEDYIKQTMGVVAQVIFIELASDNLVKVSSLSKGKLRTMGRGGAGSIFGSRNLKAVGALGSTKFEIVFRRQGDRHREGKVTTQGVANVPCANGCPGNRRQRTRI